MRHLWLPIELLEDLVYNLLIFYLIWVIEIDVGARLQILLVSPVFYIIHASLSSMVQVGKSYA